ncbi:MAG TPA: CGNR zinc finger domain-containing protein [Kribbella sp.]|nr:CGNR zinc finger domain-containing protein [Kribbella sp.]
MTAGARQLTSPDGVRHTFDSGSFALELLLTGGPPPWDRYEILHAPDALAEWLVDSHLALELPFAAGDFRVTPTELAQVKRFRETLWRVVPAMVQGKPLAVDDLRIINEAAGPPPRPQLGPDAKRQWVTPVTGKQVLAAAAREMIDLIGTEKAKRVRQCEGVNCYLMFYDTSRPGNRRWCSMQRCGNRHKVAGYRTRHAN